jgi:hypothetical protein
MKKSLGFRNSSHKQQGIALVTVLIMLVMITTLVTVSTLLALANRGSSTDTIQQTRAQNLAEAGIEKALDSVFYETYRRWVIGGEGGSGVKFDLCAFKKWLTGYWSGSSIIAQKDTTKILANNNDTCFASSSVNAAIPDRTKTDVTAPTVPDLLNGVKVDLPDMTKATLGDLSADGLDYKVTVSVTRNDTSSNSDIILTFVSTSVVLNGTQEIAAKRITRSMNLAGSPFPGNEFALLTNDINCSFCHLQIDNMKRVYADPTSNEIFSRVKLGSLSKDGFKFDNVGHKIDSLIAGTLYSRGTVVPPTNDTTNFFAPWVDAANPGYVKIGTNNAIGGSLTTSLYKAVGAGAGYDPAANPTDTLAIDGSAADAQAKGKVYYNYPAATKPAPDGVLPDTFPQIVDDTNSDGLISDDEWTSYMAGAPKGSLIANGAVVYGVSRPGFVGSTKIGANIPVSYDPIAANNGTYSGTRLGDKFLNGSIWNGAGSGNPARVVGGNMTIAELQADILRLNLLTNTWAGTRATADFNNMTAAETRFTNQWRGWLLQQALSSPNNRDLRPTNTTADTISTNNGTLAIPVFTPLRTPNVNGLAQNNFWTAYDPVLGNFYLAYCRTDPCRILASSTNAATNPESGVRNSSIIPGVDALAPDIAILNVPMVDTDLFPQASNDALADVSSGTYSETSGLFNGNLIIDAGRIGSSNISISVTGTIHVNGDFVIRGQVKGEARFIVRGNVYVVGDLVYGCETTACKIVDGTKPSYRIPKELPKLALLAGGSIIVGDYDHTDFRANRSQLNLINDQVGQNRQPTAGATAAATTSWNMLTVPGATGTNMTDNRTNGSSGNMGFVPMMAAFGNSHTNVRFASAPFGFMVARTGFGAYEGTKINSLGSYSIQTLYPSNGQLKIGGNTTRGLGTNTSVISNAALSCLNAPMPPIPTVFDANLKSLNAGFWCAPTEKSVRNWNTTGPDPANTATTTWMNQPTSNAGLDGGIGMTTGWLGGLLRTNLVGTGFDQLGDLSQTKLLKLFWLSTMESTADRDPNIANMQSVGPLRTDGMFYSRNSLFCVARYYQDSLSRSTLISNTQARWIHNGSVLSFELGFLLTGDVSNSASQFTTIRNTPIDFTPAVSPATNKGPSMGVFFDDRLSGILGLTGGGLEIRRTGVFTQTGR